MSLEKVKEALIIGLNAVEAAGWTRSQAKEADEIREAIAELDKPVGEDDIADIIRAHLNSMPVNFDRFDETEKLSEKLKQYAESFHARQCEKCKRDEVEARR